MSASPNVLYVFEYYPVLSQTFLRREIAGLRAQGVRIEILSQHAPSAADRAQALVLRRDSSNDRPLTLILSPGGERKLSSPLSCKGSRVRETRPSFAAKGQDEGVNPSSQTTGERSIPSPLPSKGEGQGEGSSCPPVISPQIRCVPALADMPVDYFRWWEAAKLLVALPREILRDHALLRDGWRLWRQYRPTNSENYWTTIWAAIVAICRAKRIRLQKPDIIHGVWATGPATTAAILSRLCGIPFSFGGHAYDIYRHGGDAFLVPKLRAASFVHTTTEAGVKYLRERAGQAGANIILARRGLDQLPSKPAVKHLSLDRLPPHLNPLPQTTGEKSLPSPLPCKGEGQGEGSFSALLPDKSVTQQERDAQPHLIRLLSVGRLFPKKGHAHQLAACALLKSWGVPFVARIVGDGPLQDELQRRIDREGLHDVVTLSGEIPPDQVAEQYRWADVFWHTGVIDPEGDRDGLPNVIPEAFAHYLPVISSRTPGPMEAVAHEKTGLLVDVSDAKELASAVKRLAADAALRQRLGENGRRWTEGNFLISRNTEILARAFREACKG